MDEAARARIRALHEQAEVLSDGRTAAAQAPEGGAPDLEARPASPAGGQISADGPSLADEDDGGAGPKAGGFSAKDINREFALVLMGSKAVVVREANGGPVDDRSRVLTLDAFKAWFANRFTERRGADGKVKAVSWASAWLTSCWRRSYAGIEFFPNPDGAASTPGYLNLWRGFAYAPAPKPNGWKTLRDHMLTNICRGDEKLFAWVFGFFAHMVQRPRERIGVALVLRGAMGSGKTVVGEHMGALLPQHYFLVDDPRYVTGQFNAHMASCLLLQADEAVWAGDKAAEGRLKGLVTSPIQQIEAKGVDPIRLKNYVRLVMTSNENWVVPAGRDERRFCVLDVDPRCSQQHGYFAEMAAELADGGYAALLHDLMAFDLASVDLRTIPKTAALLYQKERSLDPIAAWWLDRLDSGRTTRAAETWDDFAPTARLFDDYIAHADRVGVKRRADETIFGQDLRRLAPGLTRVRRTVGTGRQWCYAIPSLAACREAWEQAMGQPREWFAEPDDPHEAGERDGEGEF